MKQLTSGHASDYFLSANNVEMLCDSSTQWKLRCCRWVLLSQWSLIPEMSNSPQMFQIIHWFYRKLNTCWQNTPLPKKELGYFRRNNLSAPSFVERECFKRDHNRKCQPFSSQPLSDFVWFLSSHQLLLASRAAGYSYLCQPVKYSNDVNEVRVSSLQHTQHITHLHISSVCAQIHTGSTPSN